MSHPLTTAYRTYYEQQASPIDRQSGARQLRRLITAVAADIPSTLSAYESLNDELFALWQVFAGRSDPANFEEFLTTGSTRNVARRYKIGPHAGLLMRVMWDLTRFPYGVREIVKLHSQSDRFLPLSVTSDPADFYPHTIHCGALHRQLLPELLDILRHFLARYPACSLIAVPDSLLFLNSHPQFEEFVIAHREHFNLMSQHWEPFYRRRALRREGVHINDAMTDWTTGLNFYTCRAGYRHSRPTFAWGDGRRVNLLNLIPSAEMRSGTEEDLFVPRSVSRCPCGFNRLDFDFIPHPVTAIRIPGGKSSTISPLPSG